MPTATVKKKKIIPSCYASFSRPLTLLVNSPHLHYSGSVTISDIKVIYVSLFCFVLIRIIWFWEFEIYRLLWIYPSYCDCFSFSSKSVLYAQHDFHDGAANGVYESLKLLRNSGFDRSAEIFEGWAWLGW